MKNIRKKDGIKGEILALGWKMQDTDRMKNSRKAVKKVICEFPDATEVEGVCEEETDSHFKIAYQHEGLLQEVWVPKDFIVLTFSQ